MTMLKEAQDFKYMRHAIRMAGFALGTTSSNPAVGCVIVKDNKVIAASATASGGRPHAETIALEMAGDLAKGADMYVTLEPCSHHGQTSPCAEKVVAAGIRRVVIANVDPFIKVNGNGIKILKEAGVAVVVGVCASETAHLYDGFFSVQNRGRPFVMLKTATSLDGKIALANGKSKWITGEDARNNVHFLRARSDAVVTGVATIATDNPMLTCRLPGMYQRSPIRVVLDSNLRILPESKVVNTAKEVPCFIMTIAESIASNMSKVKELKDQGVKVVEVNKAKNGKLCLEDTMLKLGQAGINNVMIEAGRSINSAALKLGLVDMINWYMAPMIIGDDGIAAFSDMNVADLSRSYGFTVVSSRLYGCDTKLQLRKVAK